MRKTEFDDLIRKNEADTLGKACFGYKIADTSKVYENYYSNQAFSAFLDEMKKTYSNAYQAYYCGKGSELREHPVRYGMMPPKMASAASSSRFCFLALRDGADALGGTGDVKFEYECKIKGISGTAPQLDAYVQNENLFIEAKCHEIFDSHRITMKKKYWNLICGKNNQFGLNELPMGDKEEFDIPLSLFGVNKEYSMFDVKQLLCHLLGVAAHPGDAKKLIFLFFRPETDGEAQTSIECVFSELKQEIDSIFNSSPIKCFCSANNIELLAAAEKAKTMRALKINNMDVIC